MTECFGQVKIIIRNKVIIEKKIGKSKVMPVKKMKLRNTVIIEKK